MSAPGPHSRGGCRTLPRRTLRTEHTAVSGPASPRAVGARVASTLESEREGLSGVNLNEELTNLLRYQRAFQAAAQLVNVVNSTLDDLMQLL